MTRTRLATPAAVVAATAALTLALTTAASADLTTRCNGEGGAVTLPTDLVVPRGADCVLEGTVIQGDVRVARSANLIMTDVVIEGEVRVAADAYLDSLTSEVAGTVRARNAFGTYLDESSVGSVDSRLGATADDPAFVLAFNSSSAGDVRARGGELYLEGGDVGGMVLARDTEYADVYDSFIDGEFRAIRNASGVVACAVVIQGESRLVDNELGVQLGGDGPLDDCDGASYWGDDVLVRGTMGDTYLDNNIVNGDLTLRNNDPVAVIGDGNRVRGSVNGEFEAEADAASSSLKSADAKRAATISPDVQLKAADEPVMMSSVGETALDKAEARRDVATREAAEEGAAF